MIISASRRTDIPAFYAEWFINRIRAGFCSVPNPFNRNQVSRVSLAPEDVDVIVFWTRNPRPLFPYLPELDRHGYRYYFQYTLIDNPNEIDPKSPKVDYSIRTFQELAKLIGPERVIWRYDPIVFSDFTDVNYHLTKYISLAASLGGYSKRSVISIMDAYPKASKRLRDMTAAGIHLLLPPDLETAIPELIPQLVSTASQNEMEIFSCSETYDLSALGVLPGKCVDDHYIERIFGISVGSKKDPSQRSECGCVISKDVGMYDSCLFGCQYCYATSSFERAKENHAIHNPESPSILGWYETDDSKKQSRSSGIKPKQFSLWDNKNDEEKNAD